MATIALYIDKEMPQRWMESHTFSIDDLTMLSEPKEITTISGKQRVFYGSVPTGELDVHHFLDEVIEKTDKDVIQPFKNLEKGDKETLLERFKKCLLKATKGLLNNLPLDDGKISKAIEKEFREDVSEYGLYGKKHVSRIDKNLIRIGSAVTIPAGYMRLAVLKATNSLNDFKMHINKIVPEMKGKVTYAEKDLEVGTKSAISYVLLKLLKISPTFVRQSALGTVIGLQDLLKIAHRALLEVELASKKKIGMAVAGGCAGAGVGALVAVGGISLGFALALWAIPLFAAVGFVVGAGATAGCMALYEYKRKKDK